MIYYDFCQMFWSAAARFRLGCEPIALYWYLLERWQKSEYCSDLVIPNADIMETLQLTERALRTARTALIDAGLILFAAGHARKHPTYIMRMGEQKAVPKKKVETPPPRRRTAKKAVSDATELSLFGKEKKQKAVPKKKVETPPPSIDEVVGICMQKGMSKQEAEEFYYYYDAQGWVTSSGQKIKRVDSMVNRWLTNEKAKKNGTKTNRQSNLRQQRNDELQAYIFDGLQDER